MFSLQISLCLWNPCLLSRARCFFFLSTAVILFFWDFLIQAHFLSAACYFLSRSPDLRFPPFLAFFFRPPVPPPRVSMIVSSDLSIRDRISYAATHFFSFNNALSGPFWSIFLWHLVRRDSFSFFSFFPPPGMGNMRHVHFSLLSGFRSTFLAAHFGAGFL